MHKMLIGGALALMWSMAVPFAQQQQAPAPEPAPAHKVYVLTGCLDARADAPAIFTLSKATAIGEAPPEPAGVSAAEARAVGTSGTAEGEGGTFQLQAVSGLTSQGKDEEALKAHAGQRVEVTVRPVDVMAAAPAPAAGSVTTPEQPAEPLPPRYTVTEIKAVAGTCA